MNANWYRYIAVLGGLLAISWLAMGAAPVAYDDFYGVDEDNALTVAAPGVLENDTDADGDPLTAVLISSTSDGVLSLNSDGSFTYEPDTDFNGTDTFTYVANDGTGDSNQATVTITVSSINDVPVGVDEFLTTEPATAVSFTVMASDPDIDPLFPEGHPLTFLIISGPSHGAVSGDLAFVTYEFPDIASVYLTYIPTTGYVGVDSITVSVTDPFAAVGIAVIQIEVGESRVFGTLSARWNTSITFEGEPFSVSAFRSTLTAFYKVGSLNIQGDATFADSSFSSLKLKADFPFGDAATVRSTLSFDPTAPAFSYWQTVTRFSFFDLDFINTIHVPQSVSALYAKFVVRGRVGGLSLTSTTKFTGTCLAFDEEQLRFSWRWPDCDLSLNAKLGIKYEGFDKFSLTIRKIPFFRADPLSFGIYLQLETTFTTSSKTLSPTFTCKSDWFDCIKILCELVKSDDTTIDGISLYGVKFRTSFFGGIELRMDTSFVEEKNSSVTGYSKYFEAWKLFGPITSCCGGGGRWQIETYFECSGSQLFDWGMTSFKLETSLTDQVGLSTRFEFRSDAPIWEWEFGWNVTW